MNSHIYLIPHLYLEYITFSTCF